MEPISLKKCEEHGCNHLATKIGDKPFDYCLQHLKSEDCEKIEALLSKGMDLQFSVIDGRNSNGYPFTTLPSNPQKGLSLRGSIFLAIDFSSADFERVDLSFCCFIGCDLRRARLYNSSLRWTYFNRTLLRQADISNSDCRWMQAQSIENDKLSSLASVCSHLAAKHKIAASQYLHIIGRDDSEFFFRRFGYEANEKEKELFKQQKFEELAKAAKEIESSDSPTSCPNKKGLLSLESILQQVITTVPKTDWSGAAIRDSDLAYSSFDYTLAVEVVFDGSDLHEASFRHATLHRSSFLNVSFSRCDLSTSITHSQDNRKLVISRFKEAKMEGCVLDGTNLEGLFFEGTVLNNASMKGAFLRNAVFFACDMRNITADDVVGENAFFLASNLSGSSFIGSILNNAKFWWDASDCLPIKLQDNEKEQLERRYQKLSKEKKERTDLKAINFQAAELEGVIFNKSILNGALFRAASLRKAHLIDTYCLGVQFNACNIDGTNFKESDLTASSFKDAGIEDAPPIFDNAVLEDAVLSSMDLTETKFIDVKLDGVDLSDSKLTNAKFLSTDDEHLRMQRVSLHNTILNGAQFQKVDLTSADLSFALIQNNTADQHHEGEEKKLQFKDSILYMANLQGIQLTEVEWINCDLRKCNYSFAKIENAVFRKCRLEDSSFRGVECQNVHIQQTQDFDGADWSDSTLKQCSITGDEKSGSIEDADFFTAIQFNGATIEELSLANLFLNTISFHLSALKFIECHNVVFVNSDFRSSRIQIKRIKNSHFFYCDFSGADLAILCKFYGLMYYNVFLGCNFDNTILPNEPEPIIFVDCIFRVSSFLADEEKVRNWQKAFFVHCRFSGLKYYGLSEASEELGNLKKKHDNKSLKFKDFIENLRLTVKNNLNALKNAKRLADRFSSRIAKRLEVLIPEESALIRDEGYSLTRNLCREFRKDFLSQGFSELASDAYVEEMNCELKLHALRYGAKLREKPWLKKLKLDNWLKCHIGCAVDCPTILIYAFIFVFAGLISWSSTHISGSFLLILPLLGLLKKRGVRLFLTKHIYNYGESVNRMLWSAFVCIGFFTILYYGFIPTIDGNWKLCPQGSENCLQLKQALFRPAFDSDTKTITGCLKQDKHVVTQSNNFLEKIKIFFTCFYFSGVTFTTLGYGDISPQGLVRYLSMIEAGLGAFLIALFVFSFTRRNALR